MEKFKIIYEKDKKGIYNINLIPDENNVEFTTVIIFPFDPRKPNAKPFKDLNQFLSYLKEYFPYEVEYNKENNEIILNTPALEESSE